MVFWVMFWCFVIFSVMLGIATGSLAWGLAGFFGWASAYMFRKVFDE